MIHPFHPSNPFSLAPLDALGDVALGQAIVEYSRFIIECRQCQDFPLEAEIEALEHAFAETEEEITRRGRLLLFLEAADKLAVLQHALIEEWTGRGWQVKTVRGFGSSDRPQFLVRLVVEESAVIPVSAEAAPGPLR